MRYPTYLEIGPNGHAIAYVFSLPGLSVRARRGEIALANLPEAIMGELTRLRAAGRPVAAEGESIEISEAERIPVASDIEHGVSSAMFKYELRPTRDEDVALALDRMALAREEMLRTLDGAEPAASSPAGDAMIAQADGEWWLVSKLGTRPLASFPLEPLPRFEAVRAMTLERFANLLPGDRERHAVFATEQWTTRKVLRRLACLARDSALAVAKPALPRV